MTVQTATRLMSGIFALCGVMSLIASVFNFDWFFRSANVRMLTLGARRHIQRILYGFFGLLMLAAAYRLWQDSAGF